MATRFSEAEWAKIIEKLEEDPAGFGMPEGGREASLVFASFNIRKIGNLKTGTPKQSRKPEFDFMARFCARCDFVAIQEVQDNLDGLMYLKERMEAKVAGDDEFAMVVSDITGSVPGMSGMSERLAFIYRKRRVRRTDMASDLNIDRSAVLEHFFDNHELLVEHHKEYQAKVRKSKEQGKKKPSYHAPAFVTFLRSPHVAAFEIPAANDEKPVSFAAVNAHLIFGKPHEREAEFDALLSWLVNRLKARKRLTVDNFILLGDLNLDLDNADFDRAHIESKMKALNKKVFKGKNKDRIYFPFIDNHPNTDAPIRSNAKQDQTFDQIAFFLGAREKRLPNHNWKNLIANAGPDDYDYGIFNFVELFTQAIHGCSFNEMPARGLSQSAFIDRFEHNVSDHMPIWVRLPRPGFAPPPQP